MIRTFYFSSVYSKSVIDELGLEKIYDYLIGAASARAYLHRNNYYEEGDYFVLDNDCFLSLSSGIIYCFLDYYGKRVAVVDRIDIERFKKDGFVDMLYDYDVVSSSFVLYIGFNDDGSIDLFVEI